LEGEMVWQKEVEELKHRQKLAKQMGGTEAVARQHSKGKLTVRERIGLLLDPSSFREFGTLAGRVEYDDNGALKSFTPATCLNGYGMISGRLVSVEGSDYTVRNTMGAKGELAAKLALEWRIPFVRLIDEPVMTSGGARGSGDSESRLSRPVSQISRGQSRLTISAPLMLQVPVISAVLGTTAGWAAIMVAESHWNIMTKKNSQVFVAGPPVVERAMGVNITKEDLGDYRVHAYQSNAVDNVAEDEEDLFRQIKLFLSYMPQNVWEQPPCVEAADDPNRRDEELLSIIPRYRGKTYDIRKLIMHIVDKDSIFELSPHYGRSIVTILARLHGHPVAIMSNDCTWYGGTQTAAGAEKMMRFVDLADTFHLPVIYLVDNPGFMIGLDSEKEGMIRKGARAHFAVEQATVPWVSVILRRRYGVAGNIHGSYGRLNLNYAWPSAKKGAMPAQGAASARYRREIESAPDPKAQLMELEERLEGRDSAFHTAESMAFDEIIDPRDTRPLLCEFVKRAYEITKTQLGPKLRGIRP